MAGLITTPNLPESDDFYAALLAAHEGLSAEETAALNARLILVLANHVGDVGVLKAALDVACSAVEARGARHDQDQRDPTRA